VETRVDRPTLTAVGVQVLYSDDDNRNATVSLRYRRQGDVAWLNALPLFRVRPETVAARVLPQQFAGSVFDLRPGNTYELEIQVQDVDGPVNQTIVVTSTTRTIPTGPVTPRNISVSSVAAIQQAVDNAQPGDVITIQPGVYTFQFLQLLASGTAANPIIIQGANRDTVILDGGNCSNCNVVEMFGSYNYLQNLTVRNAFQALRFQEASQVGCVMRRVTARNVTNALNGRAGQKDFYIADNLVEGRIAFPLTTQDDGAFYAATYGLAIYGQGHVVANNYVKGFGDGITVREEGSRSIDIYGNEIPYSYDDGIELDGSEGNVRCLRNRLTNVYQGISVQPTYGGPTYIIRNVLVNVRVEQVKVHAIGNGSGGVFDPGGFLIYHNTFVSPDQAMKMWGSVPTHNGVLLNNLYVGPTTLSTLTTSEWDGPIDGVRFDFNGYYPDGTFVYKVPPNQFVVYNNFAAAKAGGVYETNGRLLNALTFVNSLTGPSSFTTFHLPQSMILAGGSLALDQGTRLFNVNDFFTGAAPDLGAVESGCPQPHYGPRPPSVTEQNQVFGCAAVNPPLNVAPESLTVNPVNRAAASFVFTASYRDENGFADIQTARLAIGPSTALNGNCLIQLDRVRNQISLYNDAGTALLGPITPGSNAVVQNSQCSVNGLGSSVNWSSETNELLWNVNITFKTRLLKNVYLWASDLNGGNSGWKTVGTWR